MNTDNEKFIIPSNAGKTDDSLDYVYEDAQEKNDSNITKRLTDFMNNKKESLNNLIKPCVDEHGNMKKHSSSKEMETFVKDSIKELIDTFSKKEILAISILCLLREFNTHVEEEIKVKVIRNFLENIKNS